MSSLFAVAVTMALPDWFASIDWSHLIAAAAPIVILIVSSRFPALAPILSAILPFLKPSPKPGPDPSPSPSPNPTPGPTVPNHPILDGLLQLLLAQLMKKNGTADPVSAVIKELNAPPSDPK